MQHCTRENKKVDNQRMIPDNVLKGVKQVKRAPLAKTPEGKVKAMVKKILDNTAHCWYFLPVQNGMGQSGIPDFICCVRGKFLAIETKSKHTSRKLTALQARQIDLINTASGTAVVINEDNIGDLERIVRDL